MSKVVLDVSMSLDGFIAGPNVRAAEPMGDGGERLHEWMFRKGPDADEIDLGVRREFDGTIGATVIGRRTFDLGVGPWGGTPWPGMPSFVVTHRTQSDLLGKNGGLFAFDGLEAAARRARQAAGQKDVLVLGAHVARELLRAGLLDQLRIHIVPYSTLRVEALDRERAAFRIAAQREDRLLQSIEPCRSLSRGTRDDPQVERFELSLGARCESNAVFHASAAIG